MRNLADVVGLFATSLGELLPWCPVIREQERRRVAEVIEHVQAHYESQDVEFGKVCKWYPEKEKAVVKCNCCETPILAAFQTTCGECGAVRSITPAAL